jgi:hypothetical protein
MERRLVLAALVPLCACAAPSPQRAILDPLVEVRADGADLIVDVHPLAPSDGVVVRFAKGKGFPSSIKLGNDEILGPRMDDFCPSETFVGTALFPIIALATDVPEDDNAKIAIELDGPAIARTRMSYTVPYTSCDGKPQVFSGASTFTFFPFGRIARHDEVTANQDEIANPNGCTCMSENYFFTSYWTFPVGVTPLRADNTMVTTEGAFGAADACFDQGAGVIRTAIHWSATRTRILANTLGTHVRFVYDFVMERPMLPGGATGAVDSHVQLARAAGDMCNKTLASVIDAGVRVDMSAAPLDSSGVYASSGDYGKTVKIETSQETAPGFVVSLGGIYEHLKVKREKTDGQYYIPQLDRDGNKTYVWFRDPLPPTEIAEIELLE